MAVDYEALAEKINSLLNQDPRLATYALKVRVYEPGNVQIQGIVDVLEEKSQAEELVWGIPGVKRVDNNITVCTDGEINDEDVAFEVGEELHANSEVPESVGFKVNGGEVQLLGSVNNQNEARVAISTAEKARGVREVHSQLRLNPKVETDDVTITNNIQTALMVEPEIVPGRVKVVTMNGVATLWGDLPQKQALLALEVAGKVPGIKAVKNEMNKVN